MITRTILSDKTRQRRPVTITLNGAAFRELRLSLGWSQAEMARRIGKATPYVGHLECERLIPSLAAVDDMRDAIGIALHDSGALTVEWHQ
jgi:transcriptional regulator with XRE-family HTH domain